MNEHEGRREREDRCNPEPRRQLTNHEEKKEPESEIVDDSSGVDGTSNTPEEALQKFRKRRESLIVRLEKRRQLIRDIQSSVQSRKRKMVAEGIPTKLEPEHSAKAEHNHRQ